MPVSPISDTELQQLDIAQLKMSLAESLAFSIDNVEDVFKTSTNEYEIFRGWEEPVPDGTPGMALYLQKLSSVKNPIDRGNFYYVDDPMVDGVVQPGRFRQAFVRRIKRTIQGKSSWWTVQSLRKGWAEQLNWDEAEVIKLEIGGGNSVSLAESTGDAVTSDNEEEFFYLRFHNIAHNKLLAIMSAAPFTGTTVSGFTVNGEVKSGTYRKTVASAEKLDDGSAVIDLVLAKPQYVLNAYSNAGTLDEERVGYLWGISKDIAQTIIDNWESGGNGRSASPSLNNDRKLVNLVLAAAKNSNEDYSTAWIPIAKDTWRRWHFAWGKSEAQTTTWLALHDSDMFAVEDTKAICAREVNLQSGRSGFYNGVIVETSFGPHADASVADFSITLPIGTVNTNLRAWGYNIRRSELATVKAVYDTTVKAVGKTITFELTRDAADSFDYAAEIRVRAQVVATADATPAGADGITVNARAEVGATQAQVNTAMSGAVPSRLASVDVDVEPREDGLANLVVKKRTVAATATTLYAGTKGEPLTMIMERNQPFDDAVAVGAAVGAVGTNIGLSADIDDAGNLTFVKSSVDKVEIGPTLKFNTPSGLRLGTINEQAVVDALLNDKEISEALQAAPAVGETIGLQVSLRQDGTVDWERTKITETAYSTTGSPVLAHLAPRWEQYGYTDVATIFSGVVLGSLVAACINAPSEWGYIENLTLHPNQTFSGKKIVRTYVYTPPTDSYASAGTPVAKSCVKRQYNSTGTQYRDETWSVKPIFGTSFATVWASMDGGYCSEGTWFPQKVSLGRTEKWLGVKWESVTYGAWTDV